MCNVYKVVPSALVDGEEEVQETILHIRWHRSNEYNVFSLIPDENGLVRALGPRPFRSAAGGRALRIWPAVFFFFSQNPIKHGFPFRPVVSQHFCHPSCSLPCSLK